MRTFIIYIPIVVLTLILGSCKKFLDVQKDSKQTFIENADHCQLILDNYANMNTNYPSDGQASSDDYYLGTTAYPGTFVQEYKDIYVWQATAIHVASGGQWVNAYFTAYNANLVLNKLEEIRSTTDKQVWDNLKGSALFYRAFAFWNVAQLYCKPYGSTSDQDPGIPLRLSPDINDKVGRGTVKQVYEKITQDLQEAVSLLNVTSSVSSRPNKAAAQAMLARVYLSMEDYGKALSSASASIALRPNLLDYNSSAVNKGVNTTTPFARFNAEVLFHSVISSPGNGALLAPGNVGNPVAKIDQNLYNSFDDNDWRKTVCFKLNTDGSVRFTGNYEPANSAVLFNGLTVGEMYLTRAECYARAGNTTAAMTDLNTFLASRWKNTVTYPQVTAANPDAALSRVLLERRKELVMRGLRWTDLRRLNKDTRFKVDLSRTVTVTGVTTTYTLPANDLRYVLLIPQDEIDLGGLPQNPR